MRRKDLMFFFRQLATIEDAGLPIARGLTILQKQCPPGALRRATERITADVSAGRTLADSMDRLGHFFDPLTIRLIDAGEKSGELTMMLNQIADYYERSVALRRQIIRALIYPACVIVAAIAVMSFITYVIFPMLLNKGVSSGMPAAAQIFIGTINWLTLGPVPGWLIIVGAFVLFYMFLRRWRTAWPMLAVPIDTILLALPIVGGIIHRIVRARAARTWAVMVKAGLPIVEGLDIVSATVMNSVARREILTVRDAVAGGSTIIKPLARTRLFNLSELGMIDVGEQTGELDKMLVKVAENCEGELELRVKTMTELLQPALVIILGVIVLGVVLTVVGSYAGMIDRQM